MNIKFAGIFLVLLFCALNVAAQSGGKAEPLRISFDKGKSSKTVVGSLKQDQVQEYVFHAKVDQMVTIKLVSTSPKGKFHSFRLLGTYADNFASDYGVNYDIEFTAPETGDYLIYVDFQATKKVRSGKFSLKLSID